MAKITVNCGQTDNKFVLIMVLSVISLVKSNNITANVFPLSVIHINDFHARFEETNMLTLECKADSNNACIGGYARIVTTVKRLQQSRSNAIYLNAGDNFAGTIWFSFGRWNVTKYFLNLLKADALTIGNHEFDNGPEQLVPFLDTIQSPVLLANVDLGEEQQLQGKFLNSTVIVRSGRKIGVIGVIKRDTNLMALTGNIRFLDEVETVRSEAEKLKKDGIDIIIVLSHCGIDVDFEIAQKSGSAVDIIVGGHTHTFMHTGEAPGPDKPEYDYPAVVTHANGHKILIVQASAYAKYVGDLTVYFDEMGEAVEWTGEPIFLDSQIVPDEQILKELKPWKDQFKEISQQVISDSNMMLDNSNCFYEECVMGDVLADAFRNSYCSRNNCHLPTVAIIQAGGVRSTLPKGPITLGDIITVVPFGNILSSFDLLGQDIWNALEFSVNVITQKYTKADHLLQISGMKIEVNASQPIGNRIVSVTILHEDPSPAHYKPIDLNQTYRVVATDFLARGGNGYSMFEKNKRNFVIGEIDEVALANYFRSDKKLVNIGKLDRIIVSI